MPDQIEAAVNCVRRGGIIAYPTEAVFGLGCDPGNDEALQRLLAIKARSPRKGLILIASQPEQLTPYLADIEHALIAKALASWPGPVTWVWPARDTVSALLRGEHDSIAVRVSAHPTVIKLCDALNGALVSTSANISGATPCRTAGAVREQFRNMVDFIVDEAVGDALRPSEIRDVLSGEVLREG